MKSYNGLPPHHDDQTQIVASMADIIAAKLITQYIIGNVLYIKIIQLRETKVT